MARRNSTSIEAEQQRWVALEFLRHLNVDNSRVDRLAAWGSLSLFLFDMHIAGSPFVPRPPGDIDVIAPKNMPPEVFTERVQSAAIAAFGDTAVFDGTYLTIPSMNNFKVEIERSLAFDFDIETKGFTNPYDARSPAMRVPYASIEEIAAYKIARAWREGNNARAKDFYDVAVALALGADARDITDRLPEGLDDKAASTLCAQFNMLTRRVPMAHRDRAELAVSTFMEGLRDGGFEIELVSLPPAPLAPVHGEKDLVGWITTTPPGTQLNGDSGLSRL